MAGTTIIGVGGWALTLEAMSAHAIIEKIKVRILSPAAGEDLCLTYRLGNCRQLFVDLGLVRQDFRLLVLHFFCHHGDLLLVALRFLSRFRRRDARASEETGDKKSEQDFHGRQTDLAALKASR